MSSVLLGGPPSGGLAQPQTPPPAPPPSGFARAEEAGRGNAVTVIAGVGVLLLALGVGVLIGRSSVSKPSAPPAQVISVTQPGATTGAATPPTTLTTPTKTPETPAKGGSAASKSSATKGASGAGSSEAHPAPPTVVQNLAKKKGKSYEQESKNLPNVISTG